MKTNFMLFVLAIMVTFSLIAALQFTPMPCFFLVLLGMHVGIFLFIFSKKRFHRDGQNVGKYYKREYILLALYLPILAAKILQSVGLISFDSSIKTIIVLIITVFCIVISVANVLIFRRELKNSDNKEK